ncbi:hypothetical protein BYT27DRAFT_6666426 [Phlegmacium glaucopus]|nr:hypothetical protein BYT27DRAFT_6666426 [Phlegmacium glaucopus]
MATLQEVSENWDDDFEFQVERRKISTATTATTATSATENWDDDFEDSRQSPQKKIIQRHVEESWDDEDEEDDSAEFGFFAEEDRTVTAKSRRAALARLSTPLPLPPRSPNSSVFSVPTTIHTYSSTTHLRPTSAFALIPPSPPIHKGRRLRKKSRPKPQGVFELADMPSTQQRPSFSDIDVQPDLPRPAPDFAMRRIEVSSRSDLSSVDERPPLVPAAAAAADTSIGSSSGPVSIPPTPTKGAALLSRIGSVKSWGVRRKRGDSTTPADTTAIANGMYMTKDRI